MVTLPCLQTAAWRRESILPSHLRGALSVVTFRGAPLLTLAPAAAVQRQNPSWDSLVWSVNLLPASTQLPVAAVSACCLQGSYCHNFQKRKKQRFLWIVFLFHLSRAGACFISPAPKAPGLKGTPGSTRCHSFKGRRANSRTTFLGICRQHRNNTGLLSPPATKGGLHSMSAGSLQHALW